MGDAMNAVHQEDYDEHLSSKYESCINFLRNVNMVCSVDVRRSRKGRGPSHLSLTSILRIRDGHLARQAMDGLSGRKRTP